MMHSFRSRLAVVFYTLAILFSVLDSAKICRGEENFRELEKDFRVPPPAARPWVYWFWVNGNVTREGITADLEAMQRAGIGGVLIMEVTQGEPAGPVGFNSPLWHELIKHVCAEADRLGLEVNMNNGPGWEGSGGPWITPELSMQKIVWSETAVEGPKHLESPLPSPPAEQNYYRDIKVLAFPTPSGNARLGNMACKACFTFARPTGVFPVPAEWPEVPSTEVVARDRIVDLTAKMDNAGKLTWDIPEGKWTILRMGHTTTGRGPDTGAGLECDKMSKEAAETHFNALMSKLIAEAGPLTGKSLVATHIDSWECGVQNWTPKFREDFKRRRGYDLVLYLPVITGRIVQSRETSERFLWDLRQTINELVLDNYAGHFREMAHRNGLRLTTEAYTTCPCDELSFAGRPDEPMSEVWSWPRYLAAFSSTAMTSGGHVWGKKIIAAEAFSATSDERWLGHPANLKELGDWAFCEGINRLVVHRYAMQPWPNVRPGMSMGGWGLHYERTQTWWEMSKAWHEYLARCQHLLRQGLFTADVCYLSGEGIPQSLDRERRLMSKSPFDPLGPRERTGYNFDICPPDALLTRMSVKNGRLVLPDGMSYRLLVLPMVETMTPELLSKIKELVEAGATVVGSRPSKSPSLKNYPQCDHEVKQLTDELWGLGSAPAELTERKIGKGRLFWSAAFQKKPETADTPAEQLGSAQWIWHPDGDNHWAMPAATRYFRRGIEVDAARPVMSARLVMTAYEGLKCWVNGQPVGSVFNPLANYRFLTADIASLLKPGKNLIAVEANNGLGGPTGLIAVIRFEYVDGASETICTDRQWDSATTFKERWTSDVASGEGWIAAREFGSLQPWEELNRVSADTLMLPEEDIVNEVLAKLGMKPDFDYQPKSGIRSLRFTHRTLDGADIYFVANKLPQAENAVCAFRVSGKRPEIWHPDSGQMESPAVYDETDGIVRLPIYFEPSGSEFVVFRKDTSLPSMRISTVEKDGKEVLGTTWKSPSTVVEITKPVDPLEVKLTVDADQRISIQAWQSGKYEIRRTDGSTRSIVVDRIPPLMELAGPWEVHFATGCGAPDKVIFDKLISWSEHTGQGVKYYSGTATYAKSFSLSPEMAGKNRRLNLSLGEVQIMAEIILNGKNLGILWKKPFCLDITDAVKPGENKLEVRVVNLWINRQIGDEFLPEDSDRNGGITLKTWPQWVLDGKSSPAGRHTFTSWRLWNKNDPLQPSGLLGPVRVVPTELIRLSDGAN
jgi:hypothetical protein